MGVQGPGCYSMFQCEHVQMLTKVLQKLWTLKVFSTLPPHFVTKYRQQNTFQCRPSSFVLG